MNNNIIKLENKVYYCEPNNLLYNYLVCKNLYNNQDKVSGITDYDCFVSARRSKKEAFSPAEACAIYVALYRTGKIATAVTSIDLFRDIVYPKQAGYTHPADITDWENIPSTYIPGRAINHVAFGNGIIVNNDGKYVTVNFNGNIKTLDIATADYKNLMKLI